MEKIHWDDSFSVGEALLDRQHQLVIGAINELIGGLAGSGEPRTLDQLLDTLSGYARTHFETEEKLLKERGYPDLEAHLRAHRAFRRQVAAFCMESLEGHAAVPLEILAYLRSWWVDHILVEDMQYRPFLEGPR